jgi:two-component system, NtrC family, response regulator AtoC
MSHLSTERPGAKPKFELVVYTNEGSHLVELHPGSVLTIGRSPEAAVQIEDASVSRQHARLFVADEVHVEDQGSANGTTLVRSRPVTTEEATSSSTRPLTQGERVHVRVGDVLRLGAAVVVLQLSGRGASGSFVAVADAGPILVDDQMRKAYALLKRAAATEMSVLLLGETGVGKEVMAETVHRHSPRVDGPFLKLNCAALSDSLLESELFGHERGAFTGAHAARAGLLESTDGGTVFLDEIGELPMGTQAKLLRVLEERTVLRLGSTKTRTIDVRFVTATNRDLNQRAKQGLFRRDLYYRISGLVVNIPPLRERRSEIEPLALHFLRQHSARSGGGHAQLTVGALERLLEHTWPGNVRELRNVMERASLLSNGAAVDAPHIMLERYDSIPPPPPKFDDQTSQFLIPASPPLTIAPPDEFSKDGEKARIIRALEHCGGNQTRAAELLGISRRTLINRLEDFNLPRPKKR